jgi:hypothetical protein
LTMQPGGLAKSPSFDSLNMSLSVAASMPLSRHSVGPEMRHMLASRGSRNRTPTPMDRANLQNTSATRACEAHTPRSFAPRRSVATPSPIRTHSPRAGTRAVFPVSMPSTNLGVASATNLHGVVGTAARSQSPIRGTSASSLTGSFSIPGGHLAPLGIGARTSGAPYAMGMPPPPVFGAANARGREASPLRQPTPSRMLVANLVPPPISGRAPQWNVPSS